MTAIKHTPGPWSFYTGPQPNGCPVVGSKGLLVCVLGHSVHMADQKEIALANARLIAAAPDLLEALSKLTSFVVTDVVESCNGNKCRELWCAGCFGEEVAEQTVREAREALDAARAAIAKATGEAP